MGVPLAVKAVAILATCKCDLEAGWDAFSKPKIDARDILFSPLILQARRCCALDLQKDTGVV